MKTEGTLPGLRRGLAVLAALAARPEARGFNQLQKALHLPAPTLSRILKALAEENMIAKAEDGYRLGPEFQRIACMAAGTLSRPERLQPVLERLGADTGESAAYFEPEGAAAVIRAKAEQGDSWHYGAVGTRNARITRNGFGQVCLAFMDEAGRAAAIRQTDAPVPAAAAFGRRMEAVRTEGVFKEEGEANPNLVRFVAPVFTAGDGFAGAIGITMLKRKLGKAETERLKARVKAAAAEASRMLGAGEECSVFGVQCSGRQGTDNGKR